MNQQPSNSTSVRRIVLPSGRSDRGASDSTTDEPQRPRGLHICPECNSDLVQPVDWGEAPDGAPGSSCSNCPNCDWYTEGLFTQDQVDELEEQLDEGLADMLRTSSG